jgi:hypothetical protein
MVKLILFNCVGNEEVLHIMKEEHYSLHTINRRTYILIGHITLRNCLIEHDIALKKDGLFNVTGRRRRRHRHLQDDLKEMRGNWKLNEETVESAVFKTVDSVVWKRVESAVWKTVDSAVWKTVESAVSKAVDSAVWKTRIESG